MKNLFILTATFVLAACNTEHKNFIIISENAGGIKKGDPIVLKGHQIGNVTDVSIGSDYNVNTNIELNQDLELPSDSRFVFKNIDLFTKAIEIIPGSSKKRLHYGDTIKGEPTKPIPLDSVTTIINNTIDNFKSTKNQDSIITELHRLNEQIERLNKK